MMPIVMAYHLSGMVSFFRGVSSFRGKHCNQWNKQTSLNKHNAKKLTKIILSTR